MSPEAMRILIVDDCPEDRELYRRYLPDNEHHPYLISEAESGQEGLEHIQREKPDCVLLDHMLPDLSGLEFLAHLSIMGERPWPAVIMVTGQGDETVAVQAMKGGAQDYLVKGAIRKETLQRVVRSAVEKVRLLNELAQHRIELERSHAELERRAAELEEFAHVASHDLQEPLRKVVSFGDLLARNLADRLDPKGTQYLRLMQESARRLQKLIQDLLVMSRAGRAALRVEPTPLDQCVASALELLSAVIEESGAQIQIDPLPIVPVDAAQISQLYQNLISNALKFRGQEPPRIRITCQPQPEGPLFGVADNGIGIEAEYHERIFEAFQRLHSRDRYDGSGIGLAVCRKIVGRHGGRIWVESQPGEGAQFKFVLAVTS